MQANSHDSSDTSVISRAPASQLPGAANSGTEAESTRSLEAAGDDAPIGDESIDSDAGTEMGGSSARTVTCRAAVAMWAGDLRICDIKVQPPRAGEARVRMLCASICPTDVAALDSTGSPRFPCVLGHEGAGVVEAVGPGVVSVKPGDYVVPCFLPFCGRCSPCSSGKTNLCNSGKELSDAGLMRDGSTRFSMLDGTVVHNFMGTSTFSEYTVIHEVHLSKVSKEAPADKVCLLSCTVPTGYGAVFNTAQVEEGATAAVFGTSAVGLLIIDALKLSNAKQIIAVDIDDSKLKQAIEWGATEVLNPRHQGQRIQEFIKGITDGAGVDYAFDCVGTEATMNVVVESCRSGWGQAVLVGASGGGGSGKTVIDQKELIPGKVCRGSTFGGYKSRAEIPMLAERYLHGELRLDSIECQHISLDDIQEGFKTVENGNVMARQVIVFSS